MLVFEDMKVDTNKYSSDSELKLNLSHDVSKPRLLSMIQVSAYVDILLISCTESPSSDKLSADRKPCL